MAAGVHVKLLTGESLLLEDFLREGDFEGKIVTKIFLPEPRPNEAFRVFKVMKRPQNCISDINAAFKITTEGKGTEESNTSHMAP